MSRPSLFSRAHPLVIAARVLHDRAGHPIIDLSGERVLIDGAPLSLFASALESVTP